MVDAALNVAAEQVIEHSAYGALLERAGNRGPTAAPQNLYQRAGHRRVRPRRQLGRDRGRDRRAVGGAARGARTTRRGRWIRRWRPRRAAGRTTTRSTTHCRRGAGLASGDEIVERLWAAGVPVAKVMQPHRQTELPQLAVPRLLRGGGPSGHRARPGTARCRCGSRAGPTGSTAAPRAAAGRAQPRAAPRARPDRRRDRRAGGRRRHRLGAGDGWPAQGGALTSRAFSVRERACMYTTRRVWRTCMHARGTPGAASTPALGGLGVEDRVDPVEPPADGGAGRLMRQNVKPVGQNGVRRQPGEFGDIEDVLTGDRGLILCHIGRTGRPCRRWQRDWWPRPSGTTPKRRCRRS